jgi:lysophospholipase L1-like esterase
MKILFRGGSIAAGKGVPHGYVDSIAENVGRGVEVINRSRERDTSFEGNWTFYDDIDPLRPDVLVVHFGLDDIYRPVYRSEFKENLVQLVRLARVRFNPLILLMTSHPLTDFYEMESAKIYYRTVREVAHDLRCHYISMHIHWLNHLYDNGLDINRFLQEDPRYPNEAGHSLYAEIVLNNLQDVLCKL